MDEDAILPSRDVVLGFNGASSGDFGFYSLPLSRFLLQLIRVNLEKVLSSKLLDWLNKMTLPCPDITTQRVSEGEPCCKCLLWVKICGNRFASSQLTPDSRHFLIIPFRHVLTEVLDRLRNAPVVTVLARPSVCRWRIG